MKLFQKRNGNQPMILLVQHEFQEAMQAAFARDFMMVDATGDSLGRRCCVEAEH